MTKLTKPEDFPRHIIVDETSKTLFIEVRKRIDGQPITMEWNNITQGHWHEYVPEQVRAQLNVAVSQGLKVKPFIGEGIGNRDHVILVLKQLNKSSLILPGYYEA